MDPLWISDLHAFTLKSYGFTDLMCIQRVWLRSLYRVQGTPGWLSFPLPFPCPLGGQRCGSLGTGRGRVAAQWSRPRAVMSAAEMAPWAVGLDGSA